MRKLWNSLDKADLRFSPEDRDALEKLVATVQAGEEARKFSQGRPHAGRIWRYAAAGAAVVAAFVCGRFFPSVAPLPEKEVTLLAAKGSVGDYTLPDGSRVHLNSESSLTYYNNLEGSVRMVLLDGEGYFEVSKNPECPFVVRMRDLDIEVLGTTFDARCYGNLSEQRVILRSGSVKVTPLSGDAPLMLQPGDMLSYNRYDGSIRTEKVDASNLCRWWEPYLEFDAVPLADVLRNIEDRYRVSIDYRAVKCNPLRRMSMVITHEPLERVLQVLSSLFPIKYEFHSENTIVIADKKI